MSLYEYVLYILTSPSVQYKAKWARLWRLLPSYPLGWAMQLKVHVFLAVTRIGKSLIISKKTRDSCSGSNGVVSQTLHVSQINTTYITQHRCEYPKAVSVCVKSFQDILWKLKKKKLSTAHTCESSRIIREPPGNAAWLPHSQEWDRTFFK